MRIDFYDLEELFKQDIISGNGFIIKPDIDYSKIDKDTMLLDNTLYSRKFGISDDDPKTVIKYKYTCDCENLVGQVYQDQICPICETPVVERDFPISIRGWFNIEPFKILSPIGMFHLHNCIGQHNFDKFRRGELLEFPLEHLHKTLDDFLDCYAQPNKEKEKEWLKQQKKYIFTSKIPVLSKKCRFMIRMENIVPQYILHELNEAYVDIAKAVEAIDQFSHFKTDRLRKDLLMNLQNKLYGQAIKFKQVTSKRGEKKAKKKFFGRREDRKKIDIFSVIVNTTGKGKEKILRGEIYAARFPYTARAVIVPMITEKADVCTLPYDVFRGLYKEEIIEILTGLGYSLVKSNRLSDTKFALTKDEKLLLLDILQILTKEKRHNVLVNRQPTMKIGNTESLYIDGLEDGYVMRIPSALLCEYNGDHDGDTLSAIHLDRSIAVYIHKSMAPLNHMINHTRDVNMDMILTKDQVVNFFIGLAE